MEWYFAEDGESLALEYYKNLDMQQRKKLLFLLKRMGDFGKISDKTKFTYEGDHIYAFKPQPKRFLCKKVKLLSPMALRKNNKTSFRRKRTNFGVQRNLSKANERRYLL